MKRIKGEGRFGKPNYDQAAKMVAKFGGEARLAQMLGLSRVTVYRWQYARPLGTDGLVPLHIRPAIEAIARHDGILLQAEDWATNPIRRAEHPPEVEHAIPANQPTLNDLLS